MKFIFALLCSLGLTSVSLAQSVTVYEDINYGGDHRSFDVGTEVSEISGTRNPSPFWGALLGCDVCNDDISSIRIPQGVILRVYENKDFGGRSLVLTSDCPNLVDLGWNDMISSFKVERVHTPPPPIQKNGSFTLKSLFSGSLHVYYLAVLPNSNLDFCANCRYAGMIGYNETVNLKIPAGKILLFRTFTNNTCLINYTRNFGSVFSKDGVGQTILLY